MKCRVSAIIASYNYAKFLDLRMRSLLNQTNKDLEIIVIDDKSTDNSVAILEKYAGEKTVRLIKQEKNSGWISVSNLGCDLAEGEFIIFANCDDYCEPDQIEQLLTKIDQFPSVGLVYSKSQLVNENGVMLGNDFDCRSSRFKKLCNTDTFIDRMEMKKLLLHSCVIPNLSATLFRKDAFIKAGKFSKNYAVCSDWDLFFNLADFSDFYYVASAYNSFRSHQQTIRSQAKAKLLVQEYHTLLYPWSKKLNLTFIENIVFKTQIARMSFNEGKISGIFSLISIWKMSMKYDNFILIFHIVIAIFVSLKQLLIKR